MPNHFYHLQESTELFVYYQCFLLILHNQKHFEIDYERSPRVKIFPLVEDLEPLTSCLCAHICV